MSLSCFTEEQKTLLAAWYILALAEPPSGSEPLPVECRTVLAQFTALAHREVTNSKTRKFAGTAIRVPGSVASKPSVRVTPRWKT
jgi:hypothetical protein